MPDSMDEHVLTFTTHEADFTDQHPLAHGQPGLHTCVINKIKLPGNRRVFCVSARHVPTLRWVDLLQAASRWKGGVCVSAGHLLTLPQVDLLQGAGRWKSASLWEGGCVCCSDRRMHRSCQWGVPSQEDVAAIIAPAWAEPIRCRAGGK